MDWSIGRVVEAVLLVVQAMGGPVSVRLVHLSNCLGGSSCQVLDDADGSEGDVDFVDHGCAAVVDFVSARRCFRGDEDELAGPRRFTRGSCDARFSGDVVCPINDVDNPDGGFS